MSIQSVKECSASCQMTEDQRQRLLDTFSRIKTSPYENPERFLLEALDRSDKVEFFKDAILEFMIEGTLDCVPALYIKGLPVEYDIPVLDQHDPLKDKYVRKKTFVTEAILAVAAYYTNTEIVAFSTINNGDLFHDIYMKESLKHTASQKSMVSFGFHYDMGFKSDRPDWANLACLRSSDVNRISTSLCRNIDLIENMSAEDLNILAQPIFTTPEEVVSLKPGEPVPEPPQIAVYYPK